MKRQQILLVLALIFTGCSGSLKDMMAKDKAQTEAGSSVLAGKIPDWILGRGHPQYPQERYLVGLGFSEKNAVSANDHARTELAKSMRVKIHSTMKDVASVEWNYIESVVETEINTILEGVEIKDGWYDPKGTYYAYSVMDRAMAETVARDRVKSASESLAAYMRDGKESEGRGEILSALSAYASGYRNASSLLPLKSALRVIKHSTEAIKADGIGESDFAGKIQSIVNNLKLETVSGDGQTVKSHNDLALPLTVWLSLRRESGAIPVIGFPLVFKYERGSGELESNKASDASGKASSRIHKITSFDDGYHAIVVRLDYEKIIASFGRDLSERFFLPLQNVKASFSYSIKKVAWAKGKTQAWKNGIEDLVNQIIRNMPPGGNPVVGIIEFKDLRYGKKTAFAGILLEDFKNVLARAEALVVKEITVSGKESKTPAEIAKSNGLNYYVTGFYRMEKGGLELTGQLTDTATQKINSTGNIQIARSEMNADDLALLQDKGEPVMSGETYDDNLEKLVSARPEKPAINVRVWTEKKEYQIGETITFNIKTDVDSYVTLLDIGSGSNATVIFPNAYRKDNFVRGGVTYQIPAVDYGFKFDVQGPPGLERIKAIATLRPGLPFELDLRQGFHAIERGTAQGSRDIKAMADRYSKGESADWGESSADIFIFRKGEVYMRGSRKVPLLDKPKKPIDIIGTSGREEGKPE